MIRIKKGYGKLFKYPVDSEAKLFAMLLKKQTFSEDDLNIIQTLGFTIKEEGKNDEN
jgi:hypothetical protein